VKLAIKTLLIIVSIAVLIAQSQAGEFWGSKNSNKYHYPDCRWAQKIKPENLIKFKSPEEAQKAGYIPCKVCRPPVSSKTESNINKNIILTKLQSNGMEQRQGCCSWHSGECGCDPTTGRVICCDGTLSPSCYCW